MSENVYLKAKSYKNARQTYPFISNVLDYLNYCVYCIKT